ncbi:hypothetical protein [Gemmata sp.]|uniref:hypothetical protein n=1 Tax=Gemmata sp. TaxID=1914242 RepID=UPI003F72268F
MPAHKLPDLDPATLDPDRVLSIGQVAKLAPGVAEANHCHRATIRRWATKGVRVAGRVLRLRVTRTPGGQRLVRWGDYLAFRDECARLRDDPPAPEIQTPAERKRRSAINGQEALRLLRSAGRKS